MTTLVQPESRFVDVNDVRLHYFDWGNPTAPHLVCVHGFAMSAAAYNGFARRFRDRYHIMAFDTRGHGDSGRADPSTYVLPQHLADVEAALRTLGVEKLTIIGSSQGARTSILYTYQNPEKVERLVLNELGAGPPPVAGGFRPSSGGPARPREVATPAEAVPYLLHAMPPFKVLNQADREEMAQGLLTQREDGKWVWKLDQELLRARHRPRTAPPPPVIDLWKVIPEIQCPTLVVWGTESRQVSEETSRRVAGTLPRGELVVVPGVGHPPWLTEPAAAAALEDFLGRIS